MEIKVKKKIKTSKIVIIIISIVFVILFLLLLILSIGVTIFSDLDNTSHRSWYCLITFFNWLAKFESISDPFSILIEILSSIGGVFFGIRIGQWIDDKASMEQLSDLWRKIHRLLISLKHGIDNSTISINELAEYKLYWDSLQRADSVAARLLQNDDKYIDLSYIFSFLTFYNNSWDGFSNVMQWRSQAPKIDVQRITNWINQIDQLIIYTEKNQTKQA